MSAILKNAEELLGNFTENVSDRTVFIKTPVVFLVFNRPDHTDLVFSAIRDVKPEKLLIVADGPRNDCIDEEEKCLKVRSIVSKVDWDCEVLNRFSEKNLGCAACVSQGITWAFEQVESAIILEDDCLPGPDFFRFCEELIPKYKDDSRVGMISGNNFAAHQDPSYSYHFSNLSHIWGWATWRSAWAKYDRTLARWPEIRESGYLEYYFQNERLARYWKRVFDSVHSLDPNSRQHTWDFQWAYTHLINNWLVAMPSENLVLNIGFDKEATHTRETPTTYQLPEIGKIKFPLKHPPAFMPLRGLDQKVYDEVLDPILSVAPISESLSRATQQNVKLRKKGFFSRLKASIKKRLKSGSFPKGNPAPLNGMRIKE